jgi:hypothetical protein
MIDQETIDFLYLLEKSINANIDRLIVKREAATIDDKYKYRYINNKLQVALTAVNRALDKVEND